MHAHCSLVYLSCSSFWCLTAFCHGLTVQPHAGVKAQLMVRLLKHFGLTHPCSAPLQIVAQHQCHASGILRCVNKLAYTTGHSVCNSVYTDMVTRLAGLNSHVQLGDTSSPLPLETRHFANSLVSRALPQLQALYGPLAAFQQLAFPPTAPP